MRVLVTGVSGHVGGAIASHLLVAGHEVVGFSRRRVKLLGSSQVWADLGSESAFQRATAEIDPCEVVVHAAATLEKALLAPEISRVNCAGAQRILGLAERWGSKVVYISGVPVIGRPAHLPITEGHPTRPQTAYHASKLYGEHLMEVARAGGIPTASLRLTSPAGPGTPAGRILTVFAERAAAGEPIVLAGKGGRRQNYVDVRDIARAVEASLERGEGVINVAGAAPVSNRELAETCIRVLGSSSDISASGAPDPDEDVVWDVSIERAREELGWAPRRDIADSIAALEIARG